MDAITGLYLLVISIIGILIKNCYTIGKNSTKLITLSDGIKTIESKVTLIERKLLEKGILKFKYFDHSSPLEITDEGNNMLTESKLKHFIDKNKKVFFNLMKEYDLSTRYDVEEAAIDTMLLLKKLPKEEYVQLGKIKEWAFNEGADLTEMLITAGIYLRDLYIEEKYNKSKETTSH